MSQKKVNEMATKKLAWGETPWDDMSKEELLRTVQQMYSALNAAQSVLYQVSYGQVGGYWGKSGSGGTSREKVRQIIESIHKEYSQEDIYRCFFRYADDLLFDSTNYKIGSQWVVCPECGRMYGNNVRESNIEGLRCDLMLRTDCSGTLRKLCWDDLNEVHSKFDVQETKS